MNKDYIGKIILHPSGEIESFIMDIDDMVVIYIMYVPECKEYQIRFRDIINFKREYERDGKYVVIK